MSSDSCSRQVLSRLLHRRTSFNLISRTQGSHKNENIKCFEVQTGLLMLARPTGSGIYKEISEVRVQDTLKVIDQLERWCSRSLVLFNSHCPIPQDHQSCLQHLGFFQTISSTPTFTILHLLKSTRLPPTLMLAPRPVPCWPSCCLPCCTSGAKTARMPVEARSGIIGTSQDISGPNFGRRRKQVVTGVSLE